MFRTSCWRDRRAALDDLAGADVGPECARDPDVVDAAVLVEALVLDGDRRPRQPRAHALERHRLAVALGRDRPEQRAVGRVDERVRADVDRLQAREVARGRERGPGADAGDRDDDGRATQQRPRRRARPCGAGGAARESACGGACNAAVPGRPHVPLRRSPGPCRILLRDAEIPAARNVSETSSRSSLCTALDRARPSPDAARARPRRRPARRRGRLTYDLGPRRASSAATQRAQVGAQRDVHGDLGERLRVADGRVPERLGRRASRSGSPAGRCRASVPTCTMSPISSTTPRSPAISISSPSRIGWVNAISRPAMKFPIVRWAAKPSTRPSTAEEARIACRDRADLRDHEQRREDADEDDREEDRLAQDPVAGDRPGRQRLLGELAVDDLCDDDGGDDRGDGDHRAVTPDDGSTGPHARALLASKGVNGSSRPPPTILGGPPEARPGSCRGGSRWSAASPRSTTPRTTPARLEKGHGRGALPLLDRGRRDRDLRAHSLASSCDRAGAPRPARLAAPARGWLRALGLALATFSWPASSLVSSTRPPRRPRAGRRPAALAAPATPAPTSRTGSSLRASRRSSRRRPTAGSATRCSTLRWGLSAAILGSAIAFAPQPRPAAGPARARHLRLRARLAALTGRQRLPGDARALRVQQLRAGDGVLLSGLSRLLLPRPRPRRNPPPTPGRGTS